MNKDFWNGLLAVIVSILLVFLVGFVVPAVVLCGVFLSFGLNTSLWTCLGIIILVQWVIALSRREL